MKTFRELSKHLILIILSIIMIFPFIFVLFGSTNNSGWFFNIPFKFSIGEEFKRNISVLVENYKLVKIFINSIIVSLVTAILSTTVVYLSSYSLSNSSFKFSKIANYILLIFLVLPLPTYLIGLLLTMNKLKLYSTFIGLIIPYLINIRMIFYFKNNFEVIPISTIEASRIDGANDFQVFSTIVTPLMMDKIYLSFFLLFITSWSNFLIPMLTTNDSDLFTLPILTSLLSDSSRYDIGLVFMSLLIFVLLVLIIFTIIKNKIFKLNYDFSE